MLFEYFNAGLTENMKKDMVRVGKKDANPDRYVFS